MTKRIEELLLEEIRQSHVEYSATMRAISKTDSRLAVTSKQVEILTESLQKVPEICNNLKHEAEDLEKRIALNDQVTTRLAGRTTIVEKNIYQLSKQKEAINLKTFDGWRKIIPYIILGGLSLWGLISEALSSLASQ